MRLVENQLDKSIKALRIDRGHEYLSEQFEEFCDEKGIARQLTSLIRCNKMVWRKGEIEHY